jgi:MoaA/NifB/PqqE/SkfB family radical SAM enzyme
MCNIWKKSKESPDIKSLEMSKGEITDLLSRPLFSELIELDLTGGEPHLRDDLVDIVNTISGRKSLFYPKLRTIIIASNGLLHQRIISNYAKILESLRGTNIDLVSVTSIDGIGGTHDLIRGTSGSFTLATKTIDSLLELSKEYPNLFIGIKTTVLPHNIHELNNILDFALERGLFHIISPVFFTEGRFSNTDKKEELALKPAQYQELLKFYNTHQLETGYFYSRARNFLAAGQKQWACTALYNYLYIEFDGKVYSCELIAEPIGDVRKQDIESIWTGPVAGHWRRRIGKFERCHACIEPGAIRYSAHAEGLNYLRFLMKLGRRKYQDTLFGEGFFKYFGN